MSGGVIIVFVYLPQLGAIRRLFAQVIWLREPNLHETILDQLGNYLITQQYKKHRGGSMRATILPYAIKLTIRPKGPLSV